MKIGYARVSTCDQNLALQEDALRRAGCALIFRDVGLSGAALNRPALDQLLARIGSGDVLVIWRLDRLGRSLSHLIVLVATLNTRGAGFASITEAIDTQSASGRLLFHVMGALAEFERALIGERTQAGMAAAKARGAILGRPRRLASTDVAMARATLKAGNTTITELAQRMGVSRSTLTRALKEN